MNKKKNEKKSEQVELKLTSVAAPAASGCLMTILTLGLISRRR